MTVDEGRVPIASVRPAGAMQFGSVRFAADATLQATLKRAALIFFPLALVTALVFYFVYHVATSANRHVLEAAQEKVVRVGQATVNASLNSLAADTAFLGREAILQTWLTTGDPLLPRMLANEFLAFATHKSEYDQVRFIDVDGHERVRVDRNGDKLAIVSADQLADRSDRPYFTAALNLMQGEIYISPLAMNTEKSVLEDPGKLTIHVATAAFDGAGRKRGVIVLSYVGQRILERVRELSAEGNGQVWLVNSDSVWLIGPRGETAGSRESNFAQFFPAAWERIKGAPGFGQFFEDAELFSYVPIFAPATSEKGLDIVSAPVWYLIAHVGTASEPDRPSPLLPNLGIAFAASLVLLATLALLIGHHEARRRDAEKKITELNRRLASDVDTLQMLNQELESFSYSVSHDLRGPLRAIDGFSKAILEDYSESLDNNGRSHLSRVRSAAQRMGELIDDLLKLSQVGRKELNIADQVDLSDMASSVMDDLRREDPGRDVEFLVQPKVLARCDPRVMRIALENLLGNAWKFTLGSEPAVIEFGVSPIDGGTTYFVRDNGVGFDMAHAGKLFGAFQRLHSNQFPGSGIGLATVGRIIRKHGGRAWAEARPNEGATLFFTLQSGNCR